MHDSKTENETSIRVPKSEIRILLWDIDGTLMRSTVQGGYKKYFAATMRRVFGSAGILETIAPSGMTDTQIMYEALRDEGFTPEQIFARKDEILRVFEREMREVLDAAGEPYETLGGVREVLRETHRDPRFFNALLTGNLSVAARAKLESIDLWHYFEHAPNAFGEISHVRADLAHAAGDLFNRRFNFQFAPEQFIVIGDTPNDIACARAFGAKAVAVATGRSEMRERLLEHEPDRLLDDLCDTREVLKVLATV